MIKVRAIAAMAMLAMFAISPLLIVPVRAQKLSDRAKQVGSKIKCMCRGCEMSAAGCSHPGGALSGLCDPAKEKLMEVVLPIDKAESVEQILLAVVPTHV